MKECVICGNSSFFKVKNEKIFYCRIHAEEFFSKNTLEKVDPIKISKKQAEMLRKFLEK